ncbi:hypothetical protein BDW42DRAFT_167339 [Aspergillus taichungensis]|uniref:Uncharacterized protein n=1 Tax=Aspergillus taichungensis TaxID=482145 RepID=A0A2J5HY00_9EURO|nr:hypothetical protein BDW42DRAFT_167339 [Aspergillus taichungensis]
MIGRVGTIRQDDPIKITPKDRIRPWITSLLTENRRPKSRISYRHMVHPLAAALLMVGWGPLGGAVLLSTDALMYGLVFLVHGYYGITCLL